MPELTGVSTFCSGGVSIWWTSRSTGSFALDEPELDARYRAIAQGSAVVYPRQVHGSAVLDGLSLGGFSGPADLTEADAVVSSPGGPAVAVITADCAPVAFWSTDGVVGVAHAGWRGLVDGVIEATAAAVRERSADPHSVSAALGPCIGPCCYEFGESDLALVERAYGSIVRGVTLHGTPALDMRAGVRAALEIAGVRFERFLGAVGSPSDAACTACGPDWFSWRQRHDRGRQALVVHSAASTTTAAR